MAINIFSKNKQSQKFALDLNKGAASKKKQLPKQKRKKVRVIIHTRGLRKQ